MQLTENECSEALTRLLRPYFAKVDLQNVYHSINKGHSIEEDSNLLTLLIQEYFDNPPLKFEELKEDMWVWDNENKQMIKIYDTYILPSGTKVVRFKWGFEYYKGKFEENRFYRKEVINHDN